MITESKVVIINSSGKMIPLGRINIGVLHSKILSDYLKETYPDVLAFQDLDYNSWLLVLMYFVAKTGNILLINTTEKLQKLSCTLVLPDDYEKHLQEINSLISFFKDYELIIEAYPYAINGVPDFKVEIENISYEKANTTLERFLKLDTLKKFKNSQSSFFLNWQVIIKLVSLIKNRRLVWV